MIWLAWITLMVLHLARQSPRELGYQVADLTDRFTRWQKRENIRAARDQASALQEATQLLARSGIQTARPVELVPREDSPEFKSYLRKRANLGGNP